MMVPCKRICGARCANAPFIDVIMKAALDHYTRNAAVMYAEQGIRVNQVRSVCRRRDRGSQLIDTSAARA